VAAPVYSINIVSRSIPADASVDYPVSSDRVIVVRDIASYCESTAGLNAPFLFAKDSVSGNTFHWHEFPNGGRGTDHWVGRQVFEPGGILTLEAHHSAIDVRVSGYVFAVTPA
jgi:hypothetical protein